MTAADHYAIVDLHLRYASALDGKDYALLRTCFTGDCDVHYPGDVHLSGADNVAAYCERALSRFRATQHLLGDSRVTFDGETARAAVLLQASHFEQEGGIYWLGGEYQDELVRQDGAWRIAKRTLETWWTERRSGQSAVRGFTDARDEHLRARPTS